MANNYTKQVINIGSQSNDGTGDSIRDAFAKVNQNFDTLYAVGNLGAGLAFTRLQDAPTALYAQKIITTDASGLTLTQLSVVGQGGIQVGFDYSNKLITVNSTLTSLISDPNPTIQTNANLNGGGTARAINFSDPKRDTDLVTKEWVETNFLNRDAVYSYDVGVVGSQSTATIIEGSTLRNNVVLAPTSVQTSTNVGQVISTLNAQGVTATINLAYQAWKQEHLTRKDYVDTKISLQGISTIDSFTGEVNPGFGQMTGALQLFRDPIETDPGNTAATKNYVDQSGPLSTVNFYISTAGNDNRVDIPAYKRGRSLPWAYASMEKAAEAAVNQQAVSQIEMGPYGKTITTNNFTNPVTVTGVGASLSGFTSGITVYTTFIGTQGTDPFINSSIYPGIYIEGVDSGAIGKVVNVVANSGGTEYYEIIPIDYAETFYSSIIPTGTTGTVDVVFANGNIIQVPDFWVGATLIVDNSVGGGNGIIREVGVNYDQYGNVYDVLVVELQQPFGSTNSIPAANWHVFTGDFTESLTQGGFLLGEELKYGQNYNKTEISFIVESGEYEENLPIRIPNNSSIRGDEFRRSMIKPACWPGTVRPIRSTSPWVDVYFRRDTQIDGIIVVSLDTSTNFASAHAVTPSGVTNDPLTGVVGFTLDAGSADPTWVNKVFVGAGGQGVITNVSGSVFSVNVAENSTGTRALNSGTTISTGSWAIYNPINFGYHYLENPLQPLNLLGWEPGGEYYPQVGGYRNASAILSANREFIQAEVITYINNTYGGSFVYDSIKCKRDLGTMVDGLAYDLLNGNVNRTINLADAFLSDPAFPSSYSALMPLTIDAVNKISAIAAKVMANHTATSYQSTVTQVFSSVALEPASTTTVVLLTNTIGQILNKTPGYNPGKHNNKIDVFLMNDATIIRYLAAQGHGGFMKVLDPEGQIKAKSPYTQTASSFAESIGRHRFAGGFFVDGFCGNMQHKPTATYAETNTVGDPIYIPVQGYGLSIRAPQTPCFFLVNGIKYQVDYIANYNPTGGGANTGTAILALDPNKPGGISTVSFSGNASGFGSAHDGTINPVIPVTVSAPSTAGGVAASGYATTNGSGVLTNIIITNPGVGYRRPTDINYVAATDGITFIIGGATFNFTIANGVIQTISISNPGSGYSTITPINIAAPAGGVAATAHITSVSINGAITGVALDTGGSGYTTTPNVTFGNSTLVLTPTIKKGFIGQLPSVIETVTAGNRSMLANDFTQLNDLGYGIFATNGGFIENVSMFTYYCWTSYYALNGAQIRTITGSTAYGQYGLVSEGSSPTEVPIAVTEPDEFTQIVTIYNTTPYTNIAGGTNIYATLGGYFSYTPYNTSVLEINHFGYRQLYTIKSATFIEQVSSGIYTGKLLYSFALDTSGSIGGLYAQVPDGTTGVVRIMSQFRLSGLNAETITRPSTVLTLTEDPTNVYRILEYTDLGNDVALAEADASYDYITLQPYTQGNLYRQGIFNPQIITSGGGYNASSTSTITFSAPPGPITASVNGSQGSVSAPITQVAVSGASGTIHIGMSISGSGIGSGTYVQWASSDNTTIQMSQSAVLTGGTTLTFAGTTSTGYLVTGPTGSVTGVVITDPGVGYATAPTATCATPGGGSSATVTVSLAGVPGSNFIKVLDIGAQSYARLQASGGLGYVYRFGYDGKIYNITSYTPPTANVPWGLLGVTTVSTGTGLVSEMMQNALFAGVSANSTGSVTVLISTLRATSHDMVDVGTGGYSDSKIPNDLYGPPRNNPQQANEVRQIGKGRVYFVTTDQDGNFRVGKYFSVDQGRGTVTINAPISLSGISSLSFKLGVTVNEFSTDATMASVSTQKVPVEQAIVYYINSRLGIDKNGAIWPTVIGPGFLPLTGSSLAGGQPQMRGAINMGANQINNLALPSLGTDAVNKAYADNKVSLSGMNSAAQSFGMMLGPLSLASNPSMSSVVLNVGISTGNTVLSVVSTSNVYLGMQLNSPYISAASTVTAISGNQITISGIVVGATTTNTSLVLDPVYMAATKGYVDSKSQFNQLRDVTLTNPSSGDFVMLAGTINSNLQQTTPLYNSSTAVINVTNNSVAPTNTPASSSGGSDITVTRSINTVTFKLVGGNPATNPITDYHVNASAAIQQSKLSMQAAGTASSAPGTFTQSSLGLAQFDSNLFSVTNGWVTLQVQKLLSTQSIQPSSSGYNIGSTGVPYSTVYASTGSFTYVNATSVTATNLNGLLATSNLSGQVSITNGGTGASGASQALNNLLPSTSGATFPAVLTTNGPGSFYWSAGGGGGGGGYVGTRISSTRITTIASAGQTVFSAPTYVLGADQLRVYINGVRQDDQNSDYTETSTTSFTVNAPLTLGDIVLAEVDGYYVYTNTAASVTFSPISGISNTNVQDAITTLQTNKMPYAGGAFTGNVSFSSANLTLAAGTTSLAPLVFTAGTNKSSTQAGAMEWDGSYLYITQNSGPTRQTIATQQWINASTSAGANTMAQRDGNGDLYASTFHGNLSGNATTANYADLAEKYTTDRDYAPGTVVMVGGTEEVTAVTGPDCWVLGVISTNPAHLMNAAANGQPVALTGRVPTRLNVAVTKGDPLYPDKNGGATNVSNGRQPFGFALSTTTGPGLVECVIK